MGAVLMEQNDEWQTQNRYMQIEGFAEPAAPAIQQTPLQITPRPPDQWLPQAKSDITPLDGRDPDVAAPSLRDYHELRTALDILCNRGGIDDSAFYNR